MNTLVWVNGLFTIMIELTGPNLPRSWTKASPSMAVTSAVALVQSGPIGGARSMNGCAAPLPLNGGVTEVPRGTLGQSGRGLPETAGEKQTWDPLGAPGATGPGTVGGMAIPIAMVWDGTKSGVR